MKNALVVEGGGMRGIFSAGVLDAFLERKFDPFDLYIGVSAGSCNLGSHLAGQHRRNYRVYTGPMTDPRFISPRRFLSGGHWMDLDWLWNTLEAVDPMDAAAAERRLKKKKARFLIVATDAESGSPMYLDAVKETMYDHMKASSAVPLLYRGPVRAGGNNAVDGGVADPIPVARAYEMGARKIMVVRSRGFGYVKKKDIETLLLSLAALGRPGLRRAMIEKPGRYMDSVAMIRRPPADADIIEINPPENMKTGRTSQDKSALEEDYRSGIAAGLAAIERWKK
ncbi:MAG TPA: patatin family protein [Spirochaetota bacterium]|nr:patatin family protein [Spirochaetota bacterium]HRZ26205.1 patatin family protein [Spirochaetota bacterium]HSA14773.1 patatin family protein [Spirochaetota bacterium]